MFVDFWIGEEPAMNYFIRPIQCNHEVDKSNGNRELTDSKLVLTYVIRDNCANTAINMLIKNKVPTRHVPENRLMLRALP